MWRSDCLRLIGGSSFNLTDWSPSSFPQVTLASPSVWTQNSIGSEINVPSPVGFHHTKKIRVHLLCRCQVISRPTCTSQTFIRQCFRSAVYRVSAEIILSPPFVIQYIYFFFFSEKSHMHGKYTYNYHRGVFKNRYILSSVRWIILATYFFLELATGLESQVLQIFATRFEY